VHRTSEQFRPLAAHRAADAARSEVGCTPGGQPCELVQSPSENDNRTIKSRVWKIEEKQTDVNLAIAMYRDASKGLFDHLVICSNDSDAEPALKAIREDFPGITIGVVTPIRPITGEDRHRSISTSLARRAHWTRQHILDAELEAAQLPSKVPTNKKPIRKSIHW